MELLEMEESKIESWRKISQLGSGSFGSVSLWKNEKNDEFIAIKICKNLHITQKQKQRWNSEVEIMKKLKHPNIVEFKELAKELEEGLLKFNPSNLPILSMEYCSKGNLRHLLRDVNNSCGLPEEDVRNILSDINAALSHLHSLKIMHRDIKPENIVLNNSSIRNNGVVYKLIDLGYAKELNDTVSFVGTCEYLAPEIFFTQNYNFSVDYWSLGTLAFEIICGTTPFLPHFNNNFERFRLIQQKKEDDICIYNAISGATIYSKQIKEENFISNCFKAHLEKWMQHCFQCDGEKRLQLLENNQTVFDALQNILNKKIILVFNVEKVEFYSYEIDNSTTIKNLRSWILKDMNLEKHDLIILFGKDTLYIDEDALALNYIENKSIIYAFKRDQVLNCKIKYSLPKLVQNLFEKHSLIKNKRLLIQCLNHSLYYLTSEANVMKTLLEALDNYISYISNKKEYLNSLKSEVQDSIYKLLVKIEIFNNLKHKNYNSVVKTIDKSACLLEFKMLIESFQRNISKFEKCQTKVEILYKLGSSIKSNFIIVSNVFKTLDLESLRNTVSKDLEQQRITLKTLKGYVDEALKRKDRILRNEEISNYLKEANLLMAKIDDLIIWLMNFQKYTIEINKSLQEVELKLIPTERSPMHNNSMSNPVEEYISLTKELDSIIIELSEIFKEEIIRF